MYETKNTTELRRGDLVLCHGMILRIDGEIRRTNHSGGRTFATDALVVNADEVLREAFVPFSWLQCEDGSLRWTIQGDELAHWTLASASDLLFLLPGEDGQMWRVLDADGNDVGGGWFADRDEAEALKRYLLALRRRIRDLVQRSKDGDEDATEILFELRRDGDPDEVRVLDSLVGTEIPS